MVERVQSLDATHSARSLDATHSARSLDATYSALSDPTRRTILERLSAKDARVTDVAAGLPMSLTAVSKHIRVLEDAGLVHREVRGREHVLSVDPTPLGEAASWIAHYRRFWESRADALVAHVEESAKKRRRT
jgi:DNA-binding transcriptional ArsR family regulator